MENIHNTASLAAITAHHGGVVSFNRSGVELLCEIIAPDTISACIRIDGRPVVGEEAPAFLFDALPVVNVFNAIPENDADFDALNFVTLHLIPSQT